MSDLQSFKLLPFMQFKNFLAGMFICQIDNPTSLYTSQCLKMSKICSEDAK